MTPGGSTIRDLVVKLLDRGYDDVVMPVLRGVASSTSRGVVATRLEQLSAEAERLHAAGARLTPENAVLRALLADLEPTLRRNAARLDGIADDVQAQAATAAQTLTRELALPGVTDAQLARIGIRWNTPDPEAVARAVGYVQNDAWAAEMSKYVGNTMETVRNQALRGMVAGWNPIRTAREIRRRVEGLTVARANSAMRTLQLTSYRTAAAIHQQANADILVEQIRIGTLDDRICLACIALHGTRLPAGERVDDHDQGRCVGVPVVIGRPRSVQSGEEWFASLPEERQQQIAGPGAYDLLKSGRVKLRDFVAEYESPVYGRMIREATLVSLSEG